MSPDPDKEVTETVLLADRLQHQHEQQEETKERAAEIQRLTPTHIKKHDLIRYVGQELGIKKKWVEQAIKYKKLSNQATIILSDELGVQPSTKATCNKIDAYIVNFLKRTKEQLKTVIPEHEYVVTTQTGRTRYTWKRELLLEHRKHAKIKNFLEIQRPQLINVDVDLLSNTNTVFVSFTHRAVMAAAQHTIPVLREQLQSMDVNIKFVLHDHPISTLYD